MRNVIISSVCTSKGCHPSPNHSGGWGVGVVTRRKTNESCSHPVQTIAPQHRAKDRVPSDVISGNGSLSNTVKMTARYLQCTRAGPGSTGVPLPVFPTDVNRPFSHYHMLTCRPVTVVALVRPTVPAYGPGRRHSAAAPNGGHSPVYNNYTLRNNMCVVVFQIFPVKFQLIFQIFRKKVHWFYAV